MAKVITRNQEGTRNCLYPPAPSPLPVTPSDNGSELFPYVKLCYYSISSHYSQLIPVEMNNDLIDEKKRQNRCGDGVEGSLLTSLWEMEARG